MTTQELSQNTEFTAEFLQEKIENIARIMLQRNCTIDEAVRIDYEIGLGAYKAFVEEPIKFCAIVKNFHFPKK